MVDENLILTSWSLSAFNYLAYFLLSKESIEQVGGLQKGSYTAPMAAEVNALVACPTDMSIPYQRNLYFWKWPVEQTI